MPYPLQPPPPLPAARVTYSRLFTNVGLDHTGHMVYRQSNGEKGKCYILLFTCMASRAIHPELVADLTAESVTQGMRRMASFYGAPRRVYSDNAQNFIAAADLMQKLRQQQPLADYLTSKGIIWTFQTPRAPWCGGHFERLVGVVKRCLSTSLMRRVHTFEELRTLIFEA